MIDRGLSFENETVRKIVSDWDIKFWFLDTRKQQGNCTFWIIILWNEQEQFQLKGGKTLSNTNCRSNACLEFRLTRAKISLEPLKAKGSQKCLLLEKFMVDLTKKSF